ncbi:MAG: nucleotidyltransferase family protein [Bacteroidales bacterium]|nr:nucleotidyltransferase family protein [Bacteroidales bacterium]
MKLEVERHLIRSDEPLRKALERLNQLSGKVTLFVINDKDQLIGTLTDGDIRRGLLSGKTIEDRVEVFMFRNFRFVRHNNIDVDQIKNFRQQLIKILPVLDNDGRIVQLIDLTENFNFLPIDAVIMAGGRGERLRPLTDKIPKPMLPLGAKPIIEHNIDWLARYGIQNFYLSVNYLAETIINYFGDGAQKGLNIQYVRENFPMGTVGSVSLINNFTNDTVLVMNSDLFTNIDLEEMYQIFKSEKADMMVATIPYNVEIPYAILEFTDNLVASLREKPSYTYYANAGIYLLKRELFSFIPKNSRYDMTDLIENVLNLKGKILKFPILGYWIDIGRHEDYRKAQEYVNYLRQ